MRIVSVQRLTLLAVVIAGLATVVASVAEARPERPGRRPAAVRGFQLFAQVNDDMDVNRVYCGIRSIGETCVDITGSPVLGGGSWPRGTADQYIFNSGLQIAGVVSATAGFAWAGDTVGSWFMDPRGDQQSGEGITSIFNSLNADDAANWPSAAYVKDRSLFATSLIGTPTASQLDLWWRYWDGNPNQTTGRPHPAGILVEQRGMGWNFPSGNEDIIYFIYRFINVTAKTRSLYDGLSAAGYTGAEIDEIAAIGAEFQRLNEGKFAVNIPDGGYALDNLFAAIFMDPDVGDFLTNYSTAVLPFASSLAYIADFEEPAWAFPSNVFSAPFAAAPGFVAIKYLKSPLNPSTTDPNDEFGITIFSNTSNGPPFPDAQGIEQMYRYLSGGVSPALGDNSCTVTNPRQRHLCALVQVQTDTRFFMSSGPFTLNPGESSVIVVAYVFAPPVATAIANFVGGDMKPGIPPGGGRLLAGTDTLRNIDRAVGWVSHRNINGDTTITQDEVTTVPGSLLDKLLVAQAVFDNRFLLPFAPDAPEFFAVPGDNEVTIVWRASATEDPVTGGDPYFLVAKDSLIPDPDNPGFFKANALFDRNYREFDVEGYRIWRGRSAATMEVIQQFDYAGTVFNDYNGTVFNADYGTQCAPEVGLTTSCPSFPNPVPLATLPGFQPGLVQIRRGGRVVTQSGTVAILPEGADTAVTGGGTGFPNLTDTDVPFAYTDRDVRNGFRYVYAITAFDVNSVRSTGVGNTSLESPRVTKAVTPRPGSQSQVFASLSFGVFGDDSVELDPGASWTIDPSTGRFTGPPPPTGAAALAATFAPLVPALLPALRLEFRVDSVRTRAAADFLCAQENIQGLCGEVFVTFTRDATSQSFRTQLYLPIWEGFGEPLTSEAQLGAFPVLADSGAAQRYGIRQGFAQFNAAVAATFNRYILNSAHENQLGRRTMAFFSPGGSRWFDGANETLDHPTIGGRVGHVAGADTIWAPLSHIDIDPFTPGRQFYPPFVTMQCAPYATAMWSRQADIQVTWGAGGTITSVRDVTNRVNVGFKQVPQASYGFIGDANGNGKIDWRDFDRLEGVAQAIATLGFCAGTDPGPGNRALLVQQPVITSVSTSGSSDNPAALATTGTGFGMYINGQAFIFQLTGGTPPAAGTTWTLRTYWGAVTAASGGDGATPSGYQHTGMRRSAGVTRFTGAPPLGTPAIPGLRVVFTVDSATRLQAYTDEMLARVHTVPDPYYVTNSLEITATTKVLRFVNLPPQAIIRIYSVSGILVDVISHNDVSFGSQATWDLRNRNNQFVASGVYFYHIETPTGQERVGRFTVVNFAQ